MDEDYAAAIAALESLLDKMDGESSPKDWMEPCSDRDDIADRVTDLITLMEYLE